MKLPAGMTWGDGLFAGEGHRVDTGHADEAVARAMERRASGALPELTEISPPPAWFGVSAKPATAPPQFWQIALAQRQEKQARAGTLRRRAA